MNHHGANRIHHRLNDFVELFDNPVKFHFLSINQIVPWNFQQQRTLCLPAREIPAQNDHFPRDFTVI